MKAERALVWILRFAGVVCLLGVVGLFLPTNAMAAVHEWAGLGQFPNEPIAVYLARATSALCGLFGGLMIFLSGDVQRHRSVIAFQAIGLIAVSGALVIASIGSGRLFYYLLADAAACWAYSIPVLWLLRVNASADGESD